jgi:hypothetical protein
MAEFSAVFVKTDGLEETDLGVADLAADAIEAACDEARARAPVETNLIKICVARQVIRRIGIDA